MIPLPRKLEGNQSDYTALDEALIFYRIYKKFEEDGKGEGEKAIIRFAKNFNPREIMQIKRYADQDKTALTEEYRELLRMSKENPRMFMETYAKEKA